MTKRNLPPLTDKQEAQAQASIAADPDNPEWTEADLAASRPFAEVFPALAAASRRGRGPAKKPTKELITLRIDRWMLFERPAMAGKPGSATPWPSPPPSCARHDARGFRDAENKRNTDAMWLVDALFIAHVAKFQAALAISKSSSFFWLTARRSHACFNYPSSAPR